MFHRLLTRGESMVASAGLAFAALLLGTMAGTAWWTVYTQKQSLRESRRQQIEIMAQMLSRGVEGALASGDVSLARRLAAGAALSYELERCRFLLPGGQTIADGVEKIRYEDIPANWEDAAAAGVLTPGEPELSVRPDGGLDLRTVLRVPGRGPVVLEVSDSAAGWGQFSMWTTWKLQAGIGGIGAVALAGLLAAYRLMRARLRAVGAIREALVASEAGEMGGAALTVSADLGPEAQAWNRLLADRERLREQAHAERATEGLNNRRGGDGDLQSVCDAMWQGLILVDEHMKIRYANGAAAVMLKAKREELVGADAAKFIENAKVQGAVQAVAKGAERRRQTVEVSVPGEKPEAGSGEVLRYTVRPVRKEDSASALVVIEDVTQQRMADAARNSFVAQATHELRTPLTNIRLYVDTLIEDGEEGKQDPEKRARSINVISQEARRLERVVADMLSVAEIEAGHLKLNTGDVRLDTLFKEAEADFGEQARQKDIKVKFDLPPKLPVIRGDRDKIVLALHNLVGNAIKYTPAGGEVTVRVNAEGTDVRVEVIDNGIGIRAEESDLVFEKFYRAKDRRIAGITGSGLGLALAREVARQHGGDITVRSQVDKGSTFTMTLPMAA